jgi:hypothetical protein
MTGVRVRYLMPLGIWLLAAVVTTLVEGTPQRLPAVALGSSVLLHALRAGALFAIGLAVATAAARAARGELPAQLSTAGLAYDSAQLAAESSSDLQAEIDELAATVAELAARIDDPRAPT